MSKFKEKNEETLSSLAECNIATEFVRFTLGTAHRYAVGCDRRFQGEPYARGEGRLSPGPGEALHLIGRHAEALLECNGGVFSDAGPIPPPAPVLRETSPIGTFWATFYDRPVPTPP